MGNDQAVADANHVLFFNCGQPYCVSHPVSGGDASLDLALTEPVLRELVPAALLTPHGMAAFRRQASAH